MQEAPAVMRVVSYSYLGFVEAGYPICLGENPRWARWFGETTQFFVEKWLQAFPIEAKRILKWSP